MRITVFNDSLDFVSAAAMLTRCGLPAVELSACRKRTGSAADVLLTSPSKISTVFAEAKIEIAAIHIGSDHDELPARIALAAELKSPVVVCDADPFFSRTGSIHPGVVEKMRSLLDMAAGVGVSILIENQRSIGSALRLWHLLDNFNHPSVGCCWNTLHAAAAGDLPAVAIPMLNLKIQSVLLQDAQRAQGVLAPVELGAGQLPLEMTVNRLRGIGFEGDVRIGLAHLMQADAAAMEQSVVAALPLLNRWEVVSADKSVTAIPVVAGLKQKASARA